MMTDQEIQEAMIKGRNTEMPSRTILGRMDDIPIQGVVMNADPHKVQVNSPVYYSPAGFVCQCGSYMVTEPVRPDKTQKIYCANPYCDQNLLEKIISLPQAEYRLVPPSV